MCVCVCFWGNHPQHGLWFAFRGKGFEHADEGLSSLQQVLVLVSICQGKPFWAPIFDPHPYADKSDKNVFSFEHMYQLKQPQRDLGVAFSGETTPNMDFGFPFDKGTWTPQIAATGLSF